MPFRMAVNLEMPGIAARRSSLARWVKNEIKDLHKIPLIYRYLLLILSFNFQIVNIKIRG